MEFFGKFGKHVVGALVAVVCMAGSASATTIINGSFEDVTGLSGGGAVSNGEPVGWTYTGGGGFGVQVLASPPFTPSGVDGLRYVESYAGPAEIGTLSQVVAGLTIGTTYELSFLWGNRQDAFDMVVAMGGNSFAVSGTGLINMTAESFQFVASSTSETLALTWNFGTEVSGALDNFELSQVGGPVEVAEPAVPASLGLGLLGLYLLRCRNRI